MHKLIGFFILFSCAGYISAASLPNPVIDGREWNQTAAFESTYNLFDYMAICDTATGQCNGTLSGGESLTGWIWADLNDMNALFNHYIGANVLGPSSHTYSEIDSSIADPFFDDFQATEAYSVGGVPGRGHIAQTREMGRIEFIDGSWVLPSEGVTFVLDDFNVDIRQDLFSTSAAWLLDYNPIKGVWLYRDVSQVPIPAAAWLFGSAILGLGVVKRRKA